jgi:hypothetical protein
VCGHRSQATTAHLIAVCGHRSQAADLAASLCLLLGVIAPLQLLRVDGHDIANLFLEEQLQRILRESIKIYAV